MLLASGLTVAFLIAGSVRLPLAARRPRARTCAVCAAHRRLARGAADPAADLVGDLHGLNTWSTSRQDRGDGGHLGDAARRAAAAVRLPDAATQTNRFEIAIPKLAA
jgi:cytochrome d ubiquinol oxidase subunit I